ncbi:exosporium protein ExsC [Bacillus mycoides]|uniref:Exosporium protein C n=1 Tax=Bacillus mycoides TaxID=1405 RepID=A0A1W6A9N5_BACMY|nr:exosporium protein ExsC [Bacillus mycoides]ARJ22522.1 exosporium protein C [Bacillus mycoides]TKI80247.1 exosporium protein C [Bacillus mycoides]
MTHIIDYQATQPINKTGETTFVIPHSPNKAILANIKLKISRSDSRNNRVELIAIVGVKGITDISQILFRIFRDNTEIFNTQVGIESTDSEQFYAQTFQAIDKDVSCGTHEYSLTVENLTNATSADVVGPLSFSGLAIGQDHKCC